MGARRGSGWGMGIVPQAHHHQLKPFPARGMWGHQLLSGMGCSAYSRDQKPLVGTHGKQGPWRGCVYMCRWCGS
jgi:hypothetical protein